MRIALLTDGIYPYVIGGMQKHSYFLVKFFAQNKIHVDLYHLNRSSLDIHSLDCFSEEEKNYIRSFVFEFPKKIPFPGHYNKESYIYSDRLYTEFIKHGLPDFIYAKGYAAWRFIEEKKNGKKLPPIGVRLHGYEVFQTTHSLKVKFWNFIYLKTFRYNNIYADYVYSYGGKITELIQTNLGINRAKIIEIPTGIEAKWINESPQLPSEKIKFIFIGRYDIRKGINELNIALKKLNNKQNFEFHFIGPIPEKFRLQSDNIIYHGMLRDSDEIKKITIQCDVLVLPSHSEGMPNVIMEAMASGCAIIATDVGAISLMIDSSNGWLINPFQPNEIADAMQEAMNKKQEELFLMKKNSISKVKKNFLWENVIQLEIKNITNIINNSETK